MALPRLNLDVLETVPPLQKVLLLLLIVSGMIVGVYYLDVAPQQDQLMDIETAIAKLDAEIQTTTVKVQHLEELTAANRQLE